MSKINEILPFGNEAWTHKIPAAEPCQIFIAEKNSSPFQIWLVNQKGDTPADMELFARAMSLDLQQEMTLQVQEKLNTLAGVCGQEFMMTFPPTGERRNMLGLVNAIAQLIQLKGNFPQVTQEDERSKLPGNVWTVDILNPQTKQVFKLNVSEPIVDGRKRPSSVWLTGDFPEILDGLCALLSLDMKKGDIARVTIKLRTLLDIPQEVATHAFSPSLSSMGEYIAYLVLQRFIHHFYIDERGNELTHTNVVAFESPRNNDRSFMGVSDAEFSL